MGRVSVFVATDSERAAYVEALPPSMHQRIIVALPGIVEVRNYIQRYYPEGTLLVEADDDIQALVARIDEQRSTGVTDIHELIVYGFREMDRHGARLWGVYPTHNPFFMSDRVTSDFRFIIGTFFGTRNDHSDVLAVSHDLWDKEDYERTIKCYIADGAVVRFNGVGVKQRYGKEPGGLQISRTLESRSASAAALVRRYPEMCALNPRRVGAEVRLRDRRRG